MKADLHTVKEYFTEVTPRSQLPYPAITASEIMALKKDKETKEERGADYYDPIAEGIGDGTFNYELTPERIKAARDACTRIPIPVGVTL